jgi:hypothetical protein
MANQQVLGGSSLNGGVKVRRVAGEECDTPLMNRPWGVSCQVPPLGRYLLRILNSTRLEFFTASFSDVHFGGHPPTDTRWNSSFGSNQECAIFERAKQAESLRKTRMLEIDNWGFPRICTLSN